MVTVDEDFVKRFKNLVWKILVDVDKIQHRLELQKEGGVDGTKG